MISSLTTSCVVLHWGSQSTNRTRLRSSSAKCAATLHVNVVFPTPPLLLKKQIEIIVVCDYEFHRLVFASHVRAVLGVSSPSWKSRLRPGTSSAFAERIFVRSSVQS